MAGRPLIIAHRGYSAAYPENTLVAFRPVSRHQSSMRSSPHHVHQPVPMLDRGKPPCSERCLHQIRRDSRAGRLRQGGAGRRGGRAGAGPAHHAGRRPDRRARLGRVHDHRRPPVARPRRRDGRPARAPAEKRVRARWTARLHPREDWSRTRSRGSESASDDVRARSAPRRRTIHGIPRFHAIAAHRHTSRGC